MKTRTIFILISAFCLGNQVIAQSPLVDRKGEIHFFSNAPLEDIEATNKEALGAIDLEKGTIAVSMLMKGFEFEKSLMQEHFNENYIESDKFPKATFKGTLRNFESLDFEKAGSFTAEVNGEIEIHGVTKPWNATVQFEVTPSSMSAKTVFMVVLEDFKVKIPRLLFRNIAEEVEVTAQFNFNTGAQ